MALALVAALAGCEEKKGAPETKATTTVAPTSTPSTAAAAPVVSGAAAAPSGEPVAPSGSAVSPSGTSASGEAARSKTTKAVPPPKGGTASKTVPAAGAMPHGNPEDGTLKYNPPPAQNPPAKKDAAH